MRNSVLLVAPSSSSLVAFQRSTFEATFPVRISKQGPFVTAHGKSSQVRNALPGCAPPTAHFNLQLSSMLFLLKTSFVEMSFPFSNRSPYLGFPPLRLLPKRHSTRSLIMAHRVTMATPSQISDTPATSTTSSRTATTPDSPASKADKVTIVGAVVNKAHLASDLR